MNLRTLARESRKANGFTLLEMLIVIAVIGILLALGFTTYTRFREVSLLRSAVFQVSGELERTKTFSRRYSQKYRFQINADNKSYAIEPLDSTSKVITGVNAPPSANGTLPQNTQFDFSGAAFKGSTTNMYFTGPYGQMGTATPFCFQVSLVSSSSKPRGAVAVIGVMGKIFQREITFNTTAPCPLASVTPVIP